LPSRYAPDLAAIHDAGFGGFARDAAPGLLRRLRRAGIRDGLVVDIGCGSGIWARALTDAGYDVLGVDVSEAMLQIARRARLQTTGRSFFQGRTGSSATTSAARAKRSPAGSRRSRATAGPGAVPTRSTR
jgi:SAM-dependent methyltransferase